MKIQNFNTPIPFESVATDASAAHTAEPAPVASVTPANGSLESTEIALLRARIEHLELVVETARGLMTANQERLLRRLHDVPQEMMMLTATMTRLAATQPGSTAQALQALPGQR